IVHSLLTDAPEIKLNEIVFLVYVFLDFRPVCRACFAVFTEPHEGLSFVSSRLVNIQQWHFEQFAVAEHVTVNRHAAGAPDPHGFPSDLLSPGWNASILADLPVLHSTVFVIVVLL